MQFIRKVSDKQRRALAHAQYAARLDRRRWLRRWMPLTTVVAMGGLLALIIATRTHRPADAASRLYFYNCSEAHAAGYFSIPAGSPGYRVPLDADLDGLACEPLPQSGAYSRSTRAR